MKERDDYTVGTMIELPRACFIADRIARHADFFSFGTNDLSVRSNTTLNLPTASCLLTAPTAKLHPSPARDCQGTTALPRGRTVDLPAGGQVISLSAVS
jgi:hypothetical protein